MKNKEMTIYELMGLIKDNKAPKEIKFKNEIFYLNKDSNSLENLYLNESGIEMYNRNNIFLDDTVEILPEENDEWEDIEEHSIKSAELDLANVVSKPYIIRLMQRQNQLIRNQKYLKERLDKNE